MESDWLGQCTCIFGFYFFEIASKFFIMSFWEKIYVEFAVNIKKLPEPLAIDPKNSKTMKELRLQLISQVISCKHSMVINV